MALFADSPAVSMDMTLMDLSRVPLPFLPTFDAQDYGEGTSEDSSFNAPNPSLKRERSWEEQRTSVPRKRRRVFSYETDKEMDTYKGQVRTPADAIILFEACRLGLLPRVQRRLSEKERQSIKSGSVFVWDEREAGMRRWTDGKSWSASRVSGSFLTYREMEGKRGGGQGNVYPPAPSSGVTPRSNGGRTPESGGGNTSDAELQQDEGPDGYRYKPDGLMKQSFSITTSLGNHLHLISYYSRSNPTAQQLPNPSNDPSLRHIRPAKGMYPESTVHEHQNIPAVTRSPMASGAPYTVPQMANYARPGPPGPPNWSPQPNGHGWHPSPHYQYPPQPPYGYQYPPQNGYYPSGPPPPNSTQLPSQYSHPSPHPPQQSPATQSPYDDRRPPPTPTTQPIDPSLASYDSTRQPPPSEDRPAQPPLQHPQEHVYGHGPIEGSNHEGPPREPYNSQPRYDQRVYPPQPTSSQDRPPPPHQSQPTTPSQPHYPPQPPQGYYNYPPQGPPPHYEQPLPSYPHHPHYPPHPSTPNHQPPHYQQPPLPPQQHEQQPPHQQQNQPQQQQQPPHTQPPPHHSPYPGPPPNSQIDPALTGPYPSQHPYPNTQSRTSTPNVPKPEPPPSYDTRGTTQASTIPSINSLMNGSLADQNGHNKSPKHGSSHNHHSNSNGHSNGNGNHLAVTAVGGSGSGGSVGSGGEIKSGDRSPDAGGGVKKKEGPQDIATDKVGFSEDRRALKVLDKGFR